MCSLSPGNAVFSAKLFYNISQNHCQFFFFGVLLAFQYKFCHARLYGFWHAIQPTIIHQTRYIMKANIINGCSQLIKEQLVCKMQVYMDLKHPGQKEVLTGFRSDVANTITLKESGRTSNCHIVLCTVTLPKCTHWLHGQETKGLKKAYMCTDMCTCVPSNQDLWKRQGPWLYAHFRKHENLLGNMHRGEQKQVWWLSEESLDSRYASNVCAWSFLHSPFHILSGDNAQRAGERKENMQKHASICPCSLRFWCEIECASGQLGTAWWRYYPWKMYWHHSAMSCIGYKSACYSHCHQTQGEKQGLPPCFHALPSSTTHLTFHNMCKV